MEKSPSDLKLIFLWSSSIHYTNFTLSPPLKYTDKSLMGAICLAQGPGNSSSQAKRKEDASWHSSDKWALLFTKKQAVKTTSPFS